MFEMTIKWCKSTIAILGKLELIKYIVIVIAKLKSLTKQN
jgi:hypothetical protein